MSKRDWEARYQREVDLWGLEPDQPLRDYAALIPEGPVLDLGVGEGRNSLPLGPREIEGIDVSPTAIARCAERAEAAGLSFTGRVEDLRGAEIEEGRYALVIAAWVLNFFKGSEARRILLRAAGGVQPGGLLYIGAFSVDDPGCLKAKAQGPAVEEDTYFIPEHGIHACYLRRAALEALLADEFAVVYSVEGTMTDIDAAEPHQHGFIQYLGRRR